MVSSKSGCGLKSVCTLCAFADLPQYIVHTNTPEMGKFFPLNHRSYRLRNLYDLWLNIFINNLSRQKLNMWNIYIHTQFSLPSLVMKISTYPILIFNHFLYDYILIPDINNGRPWIHFSSHQYGPKYDTKIAGLHQIHVGLLSDSLVERNR